MTTGVDARAARALGEGPDQPRPVLAAVAIQAADHEQVRAPQLAFGDDRLIRRARAEVGHPAAELLKQQFQVGKVPGMRVRGHAADHDLEASAPQAGRGDIDAHDDAPASWLAGTARRVSMCTSPAAAAASRSASAGLAAVTMTSPARSQELRRPSNLAPIG